MEANVIRFLDQDGTFFIERPENYSALYFPVAGEGGIKSSLTPNLGGDIKTGQNAFLMEPVSVENLHNNRSGRNFWCCRGSIRGRGKQKIQRTPGRKQADCRVYVADRQKMLQNILYGGRGDFICAPGA